MSASPTYVRLSAGTLIPGGSLLRLTLDKGALAFLTAPSDGYKALQSRLPQMGLGYVASPFVATPGADDFSIDWRTNLKLNQAAGNLVQQADQIALGYSVSRVELLGVKQTGATAPAASGGQTAAQASEALASQTAAQEAVASWWTTLKGNLAGGATWLVTVIKWLAILAVVLLSAWLFH